MPVVDATVAQQSQPRNQLSWLTSDTVDTRRSAALTDDVRAVGIQLPTLLTVPHQTWRDLY